MTINSMFLDLNGMLYDYFNGVADLQNEEIRFVGDTEKRLQEDYLRIFRYFRFHIRFGKPGRHDADTLALMKKNMNGLSLISGERIWSEMKRIFSNLQCQDAANIMFNSLNIGHYMGFASPTVDFEEFCRARERLAQLDTVPNLQASWKPQTLFSSLIRSHEELASVTVRLRLSNSERDAMAYILTNRHNPDPFNFRHFKTQLALAPKPNQSNLKDHIVQYLLYMGSPVELLQQIQDWPVPHFPFSGLMVANRVQRKRDISLLISSLKSTWAERDFSMSEEEMQSEVDRILCSLRGEVGPVGRE